MEQITGIGGFFFRADDPENLAKWYEAALGISVFPASDQWWIQASGPTVLAPFERATDYFGDARQQTMVNFRVRDLEAMRQQLQALDTELSEDILDSEYGRFCWAVDPEGNRFELWEPLIDPTVDGSS
jgi:glyoxylase I family protein